ncbi:MAG: hypothetical protein V3R80_08770 [Candidatus Tectomicrobia bacterium]
MAMPPSRLPPGSESAQVWCQLDIDLRQRAISVVAQMAFNFVKMQPVSASQEVDDDSSTALDQAPQ